MVSWFLITSHVTYSVCLFTFIVWILGAQFDVQPLTI